MEQPLNILLVENERSDAELIEHELKRGGVRCETRRVETRDEFLGELDRFGPDAILADCTLADFGAIEALQLLRECHSDVPLILVTGSHSEEAAVRCIQEGAEDYILKASLRRLPSAIEKTLKKKKAERDRTDTEIALRRSEEQYRLITENTRDLVCLLDLEFRPLYASPSFQLVLGREPKEITSATCAGFLHPDDGPVLREAFDEALFFHEGRNVELRLQHVNGSWLTFESAVTCIFEEGNKPRRILVVSRDTSDRKRAEKEIRKLAAFPRFNPNPIFEFSAEGTLSYFNDAALEMARSLRRAHPQAILPLNVAQIVKQCLSTGQNKLPLETNVGGRVLSWSFFPIDSNQVVHCYAEDVTERLNLEAQVRQAQKMDSIGQLAAGVAHDFNNLLTIIQGHAGLLSTAPGGMDGDFTESARQIVLAAERAANLTRQLLMFSRRQIMQAQLLNMNDVVANLSKVLRALLGEQVVLKRNVMDDLPAINADAGMLEQVLVNLAVNSRDAMPRGGTLTINTFFVEIDQGYANRHPEAREGSFVCLSVTDTGHGMDAATLARIFEPFFTTKEIGKGTGLGLATVYGIVKQHQGWLEVQSEVGRGTTFKAFFPVSTRAVDGTSFLPAAIAEGGDETILVVEDEPALRDLVQEILEHKGYRVISAATGLQALKVWEERGKEIDLLFTDIMMPEGVSGRELADHVLRDNPDLKVIYSSGYSLDVVSPDFVIKEGTQFLQKPYNPETLARTVRECLNV
ncbi:MAG: two-component system, cell cycle sensor histidine kinase and response regulator CckA [Verrucomicrobiota bacterium]|jgi:PAS domain S-box-containing protein